MPAKLRGRLADVSLRAARDLVAWREPAWGQGRGGGAGEGGEGLVGRGAAYASRSAARGIRLHGVGCAGAGGRACGRALSHRARLAPEPCLSPGGQAGDVGGDALRHGGGVWCVDQWAEARERRNAPRAVGRCAEGGGRPQRGRWGTAESTASGRAAVLCHVETDPSLFSFYSSQ